MSALGSVCVDARLRELGDVDTAVVVLEFENGLIATIDNSRRAVYGYDQRVELFGSDGVVAAGDAPVGLVTAPLPRPSRSVTWSPTAWSSRPSWSASDEVSRRAQMEPTPAWRSPWVWQRAAPSPSLAPWTRATHLDH